MQVPMERRVNRVTSAHWRFKNGAIGTLTHSALQHEQNFWTTFEILADGLHIIIGKFRWVCSQHVHLEFKHQQHLQPVLAAPVLSAA